MMTSWTPSEFTHIIEPSIEKYFSGSSCPELYAVLDKIRQSSAIWDLIWTLINNSADPKRRFFGSILLRNTVCEYDSEKLSEEYPLLVKRIISTIETLQCNADASIFNVPIIKKLFETLSQLIFRTSSVWLGSVREALLLVAQGQEALALDDSTFLIIADKKKAQHVLTFITILAEEFKTVDLSFHERRRTKEAILADEKFVFNLLRHFMNAQFSDAVQIDAMQCCSIWMSTFASFTLSRIENTELMELIYCAMHQSELFFSVGLNCLITMFEEGGSELCSGRETAHLLDDHAIRLTSFLPILTQLVQFHAQAVHSGFTWDEFSQKELLSKSALLLATLAEKQMPHLVRRILTDRPETNDVLSTLFQMFLIPFTLAGSYPRDEAVSDLALQIWFSLLECDLDNSDLAVLPDSTTRSWVLRDTHLSFLKQAVLKCHYPVNLEQFLKRWPVDERDEWFKFRGELADTLLMAYSHPLAKSWFIEQSDLGPKVHAYQCSNEDAWRDLEASLFVFVAISEQVIQEFHHACPVARRLISGLMHHLYQIVQIFLRQREENSWLSDCILAVKVLHVLDAYSSVLTCFQSESDIVNVAPAVHLISSCLDSAMRPLSCGELQRLLIATSLRTLKTFIEELLLTDNQAGEILNLLNQLASTANSMIPETELLCSYVVGGLLAHVPTEPALMQIVQRLFQRLELFLQCCGSQTVSQGDHPTGLNATRGKQRFGVRKDKADQCLHPISTLVELFRGLSVALTKRVEQSSNHDQSSCPGFRLETLQMAHETGIRLQIELIQLLIRANFPNWAVLSGEFLNEVFRLLQAASRASDARPQSNNSDRLFEVQVNLLDQLLQLKKESSGPLFDVLWLLISRLASVSLLEPSDSVPRQNVVLSLVGQALHRIDDLLVTSARFSLECCDPALSDFQSTKTISHPIPTILLLTNAQQNTEQIESFARFLHRALVWQPGDRLANVSIWGTGLLDSVERLVEDESYLSLRLCMTVGFTGMCLPEWSTAEPCIHLAKTVLERVNTGDRSDKASLITPSFLFETHCNLILIITRGALPRRLITKFADLYVALSKFVPDKQFALLIFLLDCAQTPCKDWECLPSVPYLQLLLTKVREAVEKSSVAERHRFASAVTRGCSRLKTVADSIAAFGTTCNRISNNP